LKGCCECTIRERIPQRLYALSILAILSCFASKYTTNYVDAHKTILNIFFITRPSPWRKPHKARRRMHPPSRMPKEGISFVRQAQEAKADIRVHEISLTTAELARGLDTTHRVIPVVDVSAVRLSVRGVLQSVLGLRRRCDGCMRTVNIMYSLAHYYDMKVQIAPGYHAKHPSRMLPFFRQLFQSLRLSLPLKLLQHLRSPHLVNSALVLAASQAVALLVRLLAAPSL
jgi:hypothetical protein